MSNDEIKEKINLIKNIEKNLSQFELTRLTHYPRYEIGITQ
jgi:hypothetical protein